VPVVVPFEIPTTFGDQIFKSYLAGRNRASRFEVNKTENAISPSPAITKASNADMTACLPLQDCIVQTTSLPAYGRKFLPPHWSPDNKASGLQLDNAYSRCYMVAAWLLCQVLKLHVEGSP
jgi:hypothetical protein